MKNVIFLSTVGLMLISCISTKTVANPNSHYYYVTKKGNETTVYVSEYKWSDKVWKEYIKFQKPDTAFFYADSSQIVKPLK